MPLGTPFAFLENTAKEGSQHENRTVHSQWWASHVRAASKALIFVELRDYSGNCH